MYNKKRGENNNGIEKRYTFFFSMSKNMKKEGMQESNFNVEQQFIWLTFDLIIVSKKYTTKTLSGSLRFNFP